MNRSQKINKTKKRNIVLGRWIVLLPLAVLLVSCLNGPAFDLAPKYLSPEYVVPDSWSGSGPFVKANPSEGEAIQADWWKLFNDPVLNQLEEQAITANPDLQAAAERFVQARDAMLKVRSQLIPHLGVGLSGSNNRQSDNRLFRGAGEANQEGTASLGGIASWEPDFWSSIRNSTRAQIYNAQSVAADFALARLSLQAELAADYFTFRGLNAQDTTYRQSIEFYEQSLNLVNERYKGGIAPELDVQRAQYLLSSTQAKRLDIQAKMRVTENAIAILLNRAPTGFNIPPVEEVHVVAFKVPTTLPSTLLERRPDIASMERKMAIANRNIGIARAAFFPNISFSGGGGFEGGVNLVQLSNSFWSYGSTVSLPIFQGGYRRAQLQQAWSAYRETEDVYRSTVLNAFREVENGLTETTFMSQQSQRQDQAVEAAAQVQNMTMALYKGGLSNSLELIYAQVNTLEARIDAILVKTELNRASVRLIRALGGGWKNTQLPADDEIQPFNIFDFSNSKKPDAAGGIDVNADDDNSQNKNLTAPILNK
ncbi:efflux transporter outer membrane subunit [Leptospira selangorensis]|uniref:Efflux transporter outer membrane subunit n=1 Tax=Leptospira selangorensis TaxID=2484982 RepID=A0A5F2C1W0_9LEPT|nr:efflux transporter outer membrane subunit [Leptospira selangorensis]TGM13004.1 efflux transporter outer membrane subunit [Leptospira selangorensis]TGM21244.1 efflux transporter outer membrane subunit [Leptospira selangorensis]